MKTILIVVDRSGCNWVQVNGMSEEDAMLHLDEVMKELAERAASTPVNVIRHQE